MRTVAIIQARMNSRRFPGKVLADLCGKPVLKHVIDRVRMCSMVDEVAVALSREDDWQPIDGRCEEWDVECHVFNVPADDLLARYARAVEYWKADKCVRVCGDNPLIMPCMIDLLVASILTHSGPAIYASDSGGATYFTDPGMEREPIINRPTGYFAEVISSTLIHVYDNLLTVDDPRREHVTQAMYEMRDGMFLPLPSWYTTLNPPNAAIDTPEDLERVAEMLNTKAAT